MATFPNTIALPKLHPGLSRRALMREMAAAGMLATVPVAAVAAPVPVPSPRIRLNGLINELFAVAREFNPNIARWTVIVSEPDDKDDSKCSLLIAAFNEPMPPGATVGIDWRQT